jgi:hypothetical protein
MFCDSDDFCCGAAQLYCAAQQLRFTQWTGRKGDLTVDELTPSERIDARLAELADWRGEALARMRALIRETDPDMAETVKWIKPSNPAGVPVWEHAGIVCTGEVYKTYVKLTFAQGAALDDPAGLFNAGLGGGTRRAIDIREGETVHPEAFKALVRAAAAFNVEKSAGKKRKG